MKLRQAFTDFIFTMNTDGSGKAASYVRALDMLGPILTKHYPNPIIGGSMAWLFACGCPSRKPDIGAAAKSYFLDHEGQTMSLPTKFLPSQMLLEKHRELLKCGIMLSFFCLTER